MILIGVGHKARHGKDSFAMHLEKHCGFETFHFADALKEEAPEFGWESKHKNEQAIRVIRRSPKQDELLSGAEVTLDEIDPEVSFLQWFGTEFRRHQDYDYWVKKLINKLDVRETELGARIELRASVADMRFVNEFIGIKNVGGYTIEMKRFNVDLTLFQDPDRDPFHVSECQLDAIPHDFTVTHTTGFIDEIYMKAENIFRFIMACRQNDADQGV